MTIQSLSRAAIPALLLLALPAAAMITAGQVDDFENGTTMAWREGGPSPNPPTNNSTGGPQGAGDNWLRDVSSGGGGAGSRMVVINTAQWTGDYTSAGVASVRMWLANMGSTPMQIRIALRGSGTWFSSSSAFSLPADGTWRQAEFQLGAGDLTRVQGNVDLATVLGNVVEFRILSSTTPDFRGDSMSATLGMDDIEALAAAPESPAFFDLGALADVNGNNKTDFGILLKDAESGQNQLHVLDGGSGNRLRKISFGNEPVVGATPVHDANGDQVPEYGVLVDGSLLARVKDTVTRSLLGKPRFNADFETLAFLSVGNAGGGPGPDVANVGVDAVTDKVQAQVKDVASGAKVANIPFSRSYPPVAAVVTDHLGSSAAREIAVLGVNAAGRVRAQVKDAATGDLVASLNYSKAFAPLHFVAAHNSGGTLKFLSVLGRDQGGAIRAQTRRIANGGNVSFVNFSSNYDPVAFLSFADSNGDGSGELAVVGVNGAGNVRAQIKETGDGMPIGTIFFDPDFPPVAAIAVNGAAGTGQNEIAVLGQDESGAYQLEIRDLLTGDLVRQHPVP